MAFQRRKPTAIGVKAPYPGFIETAVLLGIQLAELFKLEHSRASLLHNAAGHHVRSGGVVVFWNGRASSVFDWCRPTLLTFTALPWDGIVHKTIWVEPPRLRPVVRHARSRRGRRTHLRWQ
jgi:hypothetical protein